MISSDHGRDRARCCGYRWLYVWYDGLVDQGHHAVAREHADHHRERASGSIVAECSPACVPCDSRWLGGRAAAHHPIYERRTLPTGTSPFQGRQWLVDERATIIATARWWCTGAVALARPVDHAAAQYLDQRHFVVFIFVVVGQYCHRHDGQPPHGRRLSAAGRRRRTAEPAAAHVVVRSRDRAAERPSKPSPLAAANAHLGVRRAAAHATDVGRLCVGHVAQGHDLHVAIERVDRGGAPAPDRLQDADAVRRRRSQRLGGSLLCAELVADRFQDSLGHHDAASHRQLSHCIHAAPTS